MSIREWPEQERPREKLLSKGAANLSNAELLAIFLRTGVKGLSAVELALQLLTNFKAFWKPMRTVFAGNTVWV